MRWWLLLLGGVVAISLILWVMHPTNPTIGSKLLTQLIHADERTPVRGAIELIDYVPDGDLPPPTPPDWKRGSGGLPGVDSLNQLDPQHSFWITGPNFRFSWTLPPAIANPLRAALAEGSDPRNRLHTALAADDPVAVDKAIAQAAHDLAALSDEALFNAWLRSDREILAEQDQLDAAARQGLLLIARHGGEPIVTFHRTGGGNVYLVPLNSRTSAVWLEVDIFDVGGALAAGGVLQVNEKQPSIPADPADVRKIAAQVSAAAFPPPATAPASSTNPTGLQLLH